MPSQKILDMKKEQVSVLAEKFKKAKINTLYDLNEPLKEKISKMR